MTALTGVVGILALTFAFVCAVIFERYDMATWHLLVAYGLFYLAGRADR